MVRKYLVQCFLVDDYNNPSSSLFLWRSQYFSCYEDMMFFVRGIAISKYDQVTISKLSNEE